MTLRQMADSRAGWWCYGMIAGWMIAMLVCRWEDQYVSADAPLERPVVERPVLPVS